MNKALPIILVNLVMFACKAQQPVETHDDQFPSWLEQQITAFEAANPNGKGKVETYLYQEQTVYLVDFCLDCPDHLTYVYDQKGSELCRFGGIAGTNSCPDFAGQAKRIKTVWVK